MNYNLKEIPHKKLKKLVGAFPVPHFQGRKKESIVSFSTACTFLLQLSVVLSSYWENSWLYQLPGAL